MAASVHTPDKETRAPDTPISPSSSDKDHEKHIPFRKSSSVSSHHSHDSINTTSSDPLEPLERALSTPQVPQVEYMPTAYQSRTATSFGTTGSRLPDFEVDFEEGDPNNPRNWPVWYKGIILATLSFGTLTTVFYSTSYTAGMEGMMIEFDISDQNLTTLGITTYLFGLAAGALILAPLGEIYGRRPVYIVCSLCFALLVIPCALATSLPEIIIVRFFGACFGSAMITNAPGTISDIVDESHRAFAFSIWSIGPMNGPVLGPVIGGFVYQYLGWRWTNWLVLILAAISLVSIALIKESYAPTLLKRKTALRRKETDDDRWWCRYDQKLSVVQTFKVNLSRPFILTFTEPILWFWDLYIGVVYGILYLCFVAYPLIYRDIRGWSPGISGLAFCGIGLGTTIVIVTEPLMRRMINSHAKDPLTNKVPPEAAVSAVCIAAILAPVGQLIFSWTCAPASIHWIWSILAGVPFGAGNGLVFIYASNYIAGSYGIYSASALAGNTVVRSVFGGTLPLAGPAMYAALSPQWAGTLLGLLEVALIPIPFVFYKYGKKIREKSRLIKSMREDQERMERRARRNERLAAGAVDVEVAAANNDPVEDDKVVLGKE